MGAEGRQGDDYGEQTNQLEYAGDGAGAPLWAPLAPLPPSPLPSRDPSEARLVVVRAAKGADCTAVHSAATQPRLTGCPMHPADADARRYRKTMTLATHARQPRP